MQDFAIVGGGVIGLLVARELLAQGATVTVVEQGRCCREASWAGGGIVSPLYPWRYHKAVTALASWAQECYPKLSHELLAETGIDPEFERTGLLMLDAADAAQALAWAKETSGVVEEVTGDFIYSREPALAAGFRKGLWMPRIANLRNPQLGKALVRSLELHPNATVLEQSRVVGLTGDSIEKGGKAGQQLMLETQSGARTLEAGKVVVTAGAWTGELLSRLGSELPVAPVKGQMLLYKTDVPLVRSIVLTRGRYLIPRRDNHLLVGSTLEHSGFDKSTSVAALSSLQESARQLVPQLQNYPVTRQWAGLRPGAPDGIPFIGPVDEAESVFVNAGHYRNGLVLAPASAHLLADLLLGRTPIVDPEPYHPRLRSA